VRTGCAAGHCFFEIEDNGHGISTENLRRIFEPFFTTKPVGKGTGLGLSISYNLVRSLNGEIRVESRPGHGTRFTVRLPATGEISAGLGLPEAAQRVHDVVR
jgi:two-component system, NtrC family, sensor kinase